MTESSGVVVENMRKSFAAMVTEMYPLAPSSHFLSPSNCIIYRLFTLQNETLILTITHSPFSSLLNRRVFLPYLFSSSSHPFLPQPFAFVKNPIGRLIDRLFSCFGKPTAFIQTLNLPILFFSFSFDVILSSSTSVFPSLHGRFSHRRRREGRILKKNKKKRHLYELLRACFTKPRR